MPGCAEASLLVASPYVVAVRGAYFPAKAPSTPRGAKDYLI